MSNVVIISVLSVTRIVHNFPSEWIDYRSTSHTFLCCIMHGQNMAENSHFVIDSWGTKQLTLQYVWCYLLL